MKGWQNFYAIVGAAGATLIGIQFIVITLLATLRSRATHDAIGAFGTPTVFHFAGALVLSAIMCAPWPTLIATGATIAVCALIGFVYSVRVFHRTRRQTIYTPEGGDWMWYVFLPCTMYAALFAAGVLLPTTSAATFVIGAAALVLLLIGIHNSWDTVTYLITTEG